MNTTSGTLPASVCVKRLVKGKKERKKKKKKSELENYISNGANFPAALQKSCVSTVCVATFIPFVEQEKTGRKHEEYLISQKIRTPHKEILPLGAFFFFFLSSFRRCKSTEQE
eukprot:TRINITY_DN863_c2_g2_i1.p1 TRINITY_DN863_c2_g2~~TRINITY_DN863_c2_g2_i1.p1  ORF type:complete len:113 (-),score=10.14 TRINITY_DN863_c2_g2_i1:18-356(-)